MHFYTGHVFIDIIKPVFIALFLMVLSFLHVRFLELSFKKKKKNFFIPYTNWPYPIICLSEKHLQRKFNFSIFFSQFKRNVSICLLRRNSSELIFNE